MSRSAEYRKRQAAYAAQRYANDPEFRARMREAGRRNYLKNHE